jgi:hypothetical protein
LAYVGWMPICSRWRPRLKDESCNTHDAKTGIVQDTSSGPIMYLYKYLIYKDLLEIEPLARRLQLPVQV